MTFRALEIKSPDFFDEPAADKRLSFLIPGNHFIAITSSRGFNMVTP
jgi:hypothetical protein